MRSRLIIISMSLLPLMAQAQFGNPTFMAPETRFNASGVPANGPINNTDKLFAQLIAEGSLAEVEFGQLASSKARSESTKEFANMMVSDHRGANDDLSALASDRSIPLPDRLNPEHAALRARLDQTNNDAFDLEYMRAQVVDHQKAVQLLMWQMGSGQDKELQGFAADKLPVVMEHLRRAQEIVAELSRTVVEKR